MEMRNDELVIGDISVPVIDYDLSMGKYDLSKSEIEIRKNYSLKEQVQHYIVKVEEWDDYNSYNDSTPIYSENFGGIGVGWRFQKLRFNNEGLIVHKDLIVGIKTSDKYFLVGNCYIDSCFPMFAEDFGGQGDSNWYHIEAFIVWIKQLHNRGD